MPFSLGVASQGIVLPRDVAVDSSGNIVVVGAYSGSVDFGLGALQSKGAPGFNAFVVKYNGAAKPLWNTSFGSGGPSSGGGQEFASVRVDGKGNILLAGQFSFSVDFGGGTLMSAGQSDGFVAKLNPNGDYVYAHPFGNATNEETWSLAVAANGDAVVTASSGGAVDFGGGFIGGSGLNAFLFRLNGSGQHVFSKALGCMDVGSVTLDSSGNVIYGATTSPSCPSVDFGGGPLAAKYSVAVAKFDASGKFLSQKQYLMNKSMADLIDGFESDGDDHVLFMVNPQSQDMANVDFGGGKAAALPAGNSVFLGAVDKSGGLVFGDAFPGKNTMQELLMGSDLAVDAAKNVVVAGQFNASIDLGAGPVAALAGGANTFVAKYTNAGKLVWGKTFGGKTGGVFPTGVAVDGTGAPVVTGRYIGTEIDFGQGPFAGPSGMFLARFAP